MPSQLTLKTTLQRHVKEGELYRTIEGTSIECFACGHRCTIHDDRDGICKIRFNRGGKLYVPYGYVAGIQPGYKILFENGIDDIGMNFYSRHIFLDRSGSKIH